jgi:drug/metabolite transporter (DMT)-like permease
LRFVIAAVLITMLFVGFKLALPRGRALRGALVFGVLQFAGAFGLYSFALVRIKAGLGQTILALVPLVTLLLARGQERLRRAPLIGAFIGVIGVGTVSVGPLQSGVPVTSLLAVLGSVFCFAQALLLVRRLPPVHPIAFNAVGIVVATPLLIGASFVARETWLVPQRGETWIALAYLAGIGSIVVFLLHVFVLQSWSASRTAFVMVLIPFVTVVLSAWLDQEPVTLALLLGGLLVLIGVYVGALRGAWRGERVEADLAAGQ